MYVKQAITSGFQENSQIICRKLTKISKNSDHNIGPQDIDSSQDPGAAAAANGANGEADDTAEDIVYCGDESLYLMNGFKGQVSVRPGANPTTFQFTAKTPAL
jgi:hypothetical protein